MQSPSARQLAWLGILLAAFGAATFATKGIVIKLAMAEGIDAVTTLAWRMIVSVPVFAVAGAIAYRFKSARRPADAPPLLDRTSVLRAMAVGVLGYWLASFLDFSSLAYISAQLDRLILLTYPFFVVLFGAVLFRRRVTAGMIASLVVGYLGVAVIVARDISAEGDHVVLGVSLVFGSAIAYALYQILAKPLIDRMGAALFTSIAMSTAGVAVAVHFLATHPVSALMVSEHALWLMLAIGILSTVIPAYSISAAIGLIGSERTAVIGNVSPLVTTTLAVTLLGEPFGPWHAVGTALVLAGVILFTRLAKTVPPRAEPEP